MRHTKLDLESVTTPERENLLKAIRQELSTRVLAADDFYKEIENIIEELKALGHNLVLFDTDGEWQTWLGDWTRENSDKLILHFDPIAGVEAEWSQAPK